jgi:hypothetical protein
VIAAVIGLMSIINTQTPATRDLGLMGGRFKPLTYDELTPEQKKWLGTCCRDNAAGWVGRSMYCCGVPKWATWRRNSVRSCAFTQLFQAI